MKILVVGAGAVGGYFGARLAQAGRDVTFLVRPSRAQQLQRDGLRILSPHGDLTLKPQTITTGQISTPYDVILLSVKALALDQSISDLAPAVGPNTLLYPVLNGMRHMDTLTRRFGPAAVLGGVCMVATDLDDQQRIVQIAPMQKLIYGPQDGKLTPRLHELDQTLSNAGFDTELSTNILQAMWQKWVFIASLGLITCLFDAPLGAIASAPDGDAIALQAVDECASIATASGFPPPPAAIETLHKQAIDKASKTTSSMYRDLKKGAPTEVETILGDLLRHAQTHNLNTPILQAGCVRLRVYQSSLSPTRIPQSPPAAAQSR